MHAAGTDLKIDSRCFSSRKG